MPEHVVTTVAPSTARRSHHSGRVFYVGAGLFVILLAIVGFGPSIIDQSNRNGPVTGLVAAHGIAAGAWLVLFVAQATLVLNRRVASHRRLGRIGPVLALVVMGLGCFMLVDGRDYELSGDLDRAFNPPGSPRLSAAERAPGMLLPLAGFFNFGVLVAAGLWYRHRPEVHKRLMLLALTPLAGEPVIHLVGHLGAYWPSLRGTAVFFLPIQLLFLFASAIYDKLSMGRVHPVSLWVPIAVFVWLNVLTAVVLPSTAWRKLAVSLIGAAG